MQIHQYYAYRMECCNTLQQLFENYFHLPASKLVCLFSYVKPFSQRSLQDSTSFFTTNTMYHIGKITSKLSNSVLYFGQLKIPLLQKYYQLNFWKWFVHIDSAQYKVLITGVCLIRFSLMYQFQPCLCTPMIFQNMTDLFKASNAVLLFLFQPLLPSVYHTCICFLGYDFFLPKRCVDL